MGVKTGTGEVFGKQTTSWFASFDARYAVVLMVEQGGTGAGTSGPSVRGIYEAIYGLAGEPPLLPGGLPPDGLPAIDAGGSVAAYPPPHERSVPPRSTGHARATCVVRRLLAADSALHRVDLVLLGAVLLLCVFGAALVWSATRANSQLTGDDGTTYLQRHLVNLAVGLLLGAAVAAVRPRALRVATPVAYLISLLGLALVLSPLGRTYNGSHSWISLGGLSLQPAELAKVTLCLALACCWRSDAGSCRIRAAWMSPLPSRSPRSRSVSSSSSQTSAP